MFSDVQPGASGDDRHPVDVVGLAVAALAGVPLKPRDRLREVACLAIAMHGHEADCRASGIGDAEIEEGCRTMGRLAAGTARMRFPSGA